LRTRFYLVVLAACGRSAPIEDPTPTSIQRASEPSEEALPVAPAPSAMPEGKAPENTEPVAIIGYGVRLELRPPFQATRMPGLVEGGGNDVLVWSWWDTTAPGAGTSGDPGLYNMIIKPVAEASAATTIEVAELDDLTVLRAGPTGTEVRLPKGFTSIGGAGEVKADATDAQWRIEARGEVHPFPVGPMLHSADPEAGLPFSLESFPQRPWGAWPN
jgi:hypothetical protein